MRIILRRAWMVANFVVAFYWLGSMAYCLYANSTHKPLTEMVWIGAGLGFWFGARQCMNEFSEAMDKEQAA